LAVTRLRLSDGHYQEPPGGRNGKSFFTAVVPEFTSAMLVMNEAAIGGIAKEDRIQVP